MSNTKEQRLAFAVSCLKLARKEIKDHGREFMKPDEDVFDSALQYGGSISPKLTKAEVIDADQLNHQRRD